ncbi:MAG TPA: efflux RND transporter periplasmic adaptor subunit [Puia sp.]|jgi:RND family efflux transporter MFP subunit
MHNRSFQVILGFVLFSSVLAMACSSDSPRKTSVRPPVVPHAEVFILREGSLSTSLKIPGELIANREVDLYAKVNSYVKELKVDVGSSVSRGQVLATLDAPELQAQVAAAESRYKSQQAVYTSTDATYQRIKEVSETPGTISKNDVQIALEKRNSEIAKLEAAAADLKSSRSIMEYLTIQAPFEGIISARNVNLGAYIGPSGKGDALPIFSLHELKQLRLVIAIPEGYKGYIKLNDAVKFTIKAFPNMTFTAKIARRAEVMDKLLRSERIELDVVNNDLRLSPGMVAETVIQLSGRGDGYVVPKSAVLNSTEGVFLIQNLNGKAVRVPVQKGRDTDSLSEVFGQGLEQGFLYLKKASEEIHDGSTIH